MKKIILIYLILCLELLFSYDLGKDMVALPLLEVDKNSNLGVVDRSDLRVGESGVLLRWFDKERASVVSSLEVVEIRDAKAIVKFTIFDTLEQSAMPIPLLYPKKSDEALFRIHYNRALIIAPTQDIYNKIEQAYSSINWIHADMFAASLIESGRSAPSKSDFKKFCQFYSVGLLYIVNKTDGELRDCLTFKKLKSDYITGLAKREEIIKPFFSRIGEIKSSWIEFKTKDVEDYYSYYERLLR